MSEGPAVLLVVEQLRRRVPGGIGTTIRGLLKGLAAAEDGDSQSDGAEQDRERNRSTNGTNGTNETNGTDETEAPRVTLYASRARGARPDPVSEFGLPVLTSPLPGPVMVRAWDHGMFDVPGRFDVVHASSFAVPPTRRPLVVTVHDLIWRRVPDAFPRRGRRWHEAVLHRLIDRSAALAVSSEPVAADLVAAGASAGNVYLIPFGSDHLPPADTAASSELLRDLGVEGEFLLSVSTLEPRKNLGRLVEAYERARPRLPEPWPLVVVGPHGWGSGVRPASGVVLAGHVGGAALAGLYRSARLLAYVPLAEGFGFPPVEAMQHGTPVVASKVPSVGDASVEVDPFNVEEIADGIVEVATDEKLRMRLRNDGYRYSKTLTWAGTARGYRRLWSSLA